MMLDTLAAYAMLVISTTNGEVMKTHQYVPRKWPNKVASRMSEKIGLEQAIDLWSVWPKILEVFEEMESEPEIIAWMYQHEETGRVGFIDAWEVENNFEKNNPRLQIICPLYRR